VRRASETFAGQPFEPGQKLMVNAYAKALEADNSRTAKPADRVMNFRIVSPASLSGGRKRGLRPVCPREKQLRFRVG
jgi:hypothetical protein